MFGRTLRASIATDNGRSAEFSRKRTYENKQRCFECGGEGHLSYKCPVNVLGEREPPIRKAAKSRRHLSRKGLDLSEACIDDGDDDRDDNVISKDGGGASGSTPAASNKRPRFKQSAYFSDDEEIESD